MPATPVDLVSHWRIPAPVQPVWAALSDPPGWSRWWPGVQRVQTLHGGGPDGVGAVHRIDWSTRLPGCVIVEVEGAVPARHQRLRARFSGGPQGDGLWLLRPEAGYTDVTWVWRLRCSPPWLQRMLPLLLPVLRRSHTRVMQAGEAGLRRSLA